MMATISPDMPYAFGMFEGIVIGIGISIAVLLIVMLVQWARGRWTKSPPRWKA